MWFDSWSDVWRVLTVGGAGYVTLVLVLRLSGKRTLSKLNAFDFVVTVALGSTLATILLSSEVSWAEGAVALAILAVLQFAVAWSSVRLPGGRSVVNARPTLLLRDGEPRHDALRAQRVTFGEVQQAVRGTGAGDMGDIAAVVLESDGTFSVIPHDKLGNASALAGVEGVDGVRG